VEGTLTGEVFSAIDYQIGRGEVCALSQGAAGHFTRTGPLSGGGLSTYQGKFRPLTGEEVAEVLAWRGFTPARKAELAREKLVLLELR
jgi:hypothetical protein